MGKADSNTASMEACQECEVGAAVAVAHCLLVHLPPRASHATTASALLLDRVLSTAIRS